MTLEIITPGLSIYNHEVSLVQVPGTNGCFEILQNHAPIVSTLQKGRIKVVESGNKTVNFDISGGVVECRENKIVVLADWCENSK